MESSSANTTNITQPTQTYGVEHKSVATPVQPEANFVDVTAAKGTAINQDIKPTQTTGFDTEKTTVSNTYIQKYMSAINKNPNYTVNDNGDEYSLTNLINNPENLKNSFVKDFTRQANNRKNYDEAEKLFSTLDNKNYTYGRLFFQGNWINTRTPINPETGEATGLPEMIPA